MVFGGGGKKKATTELFKVYVLTGIFRQSFKVFSTNVCSNPVIKFYDFKFKKKTPLSQIFTVCLADNPGAAAQPLAF